MSKSGKERIESVEKYMSGLPDELKNDENVLFELLRDEYKKQFGEVFSLFYVSSVSDAINDIKGCLESGKKACEYNPDRYGGNAEVIY